MDDKSSKENHSLFFLNSIGIIVILEVEYYHVQAPFSNVSIAASTFSLVLSWKNTVLD